MTAFPHRATVLTLTLLAAQAGHEVGDYLAQRHRDSQCKQDRTAEGRRALARHVLTYGLAQATAKTLAYWVAGVRVPWRAVLAGQAVEVALHAVIDDGRLLRWFAATTDKLPFHDLATGGVNGRLLMDQAAHRGLQIPIGAAITVVLAGGDR